MKNNKKGLDRLLNAANVKKHDPKDETVESMRQMAWMTRIKYDELIKQGFNPDQALELCKNLLSMNYTSCKGE
tara:strand:+ start:109 stop:327 length:219 start_codon:yes stop_codon:yes gene_type:complete